MASEKRKAVTEWGRLLVATDFSSGAERAYRCALTIAQSCRSELYIVHAIPPRPFPYLEEKDTRRALEAAKEEAKRSFAAWDSRKELQGIPHHFRVVKGHPQTEITRLMDEEKIGVAVMGTRGYPDAEEFPLGALTERILRTAEFPVLTVGNGDETTFGGEQKFRRILYASNLTPYSDYAARFAFSLAEAAKGHVIMMHVIEAGEEFEARNEELLHGFFGNRLRRAIPKEAKLENEPEFVVAFGVPEEEIVKAARAKETNLIVLGVRAAQKAQGFLPSRTAYRVVCRATCPVLTVPTTTVR